MLFAIQFVGGITITLFIGVVMFAWLWRQFLGKELTEANLYIIWFIFAAIFLALIFSAYNMGIQHGKDFIVQNYQVLGI